MKNFYKNIKNKDFWFYDEVYKGNIYFLIGNERWALKRALTKYGFDLKVKNMGEGHIWSIENYGFIVWIKSFSWQPKEIGWLIHEIIHIGQFVFEYQKIKKGGEQFNYYIEWITRTIFEKLAK